MGPRLDNINKPIIEVKDKVNDDYAAHYDKPKHDSSTFKITTPVYINGHPFYGEYKIGQKTAMYKEVTRMEKVTRYKQENRVDKNGDPMIGVDGKPITIDVPVIVEVPTVVKEPIIIDEEFKQELLARASAGKAQEDRIYKSEGLRIDWDAKTGTSTVTRKA